MELILVYDSRKPKVRNQQIRIFIGCAEEEILRL